MKKLFWIVNLPRTLLIYLLTKNSRQRALIFKDLERFAYGERKNKGPYRTFSEVILFDKCFRNVLEFRMKKESKIKAMMLRVFFPIKKDMEIGRCDIGGGLVCYHGHGTVIAAHKIGENFSVWQGVTIGKNVNSEMAPTIGNNVSIYTNAVVAGNITIAVMFSDIRCCFLSWDRTVYANDDRNIYVLRQLFFDCFVGSYTSAVLFCQWFPLIWKDI